MEYSLDIPMKHCTKGDHELPATRDFFYPNKNTKDGLCTWCKECSKAHALYRYRNPIEKPVVPEGYKRCDVCECDFPATLEYFHAYKRSKDGLRNLCKECRSKRDQTYKENNPEVYRARFQRYRERHPERVRAADKKYRQTDKGKQNGVERQRRHRQNPLVRERERRARMRYYWSHLEQERAYCKNYRETHREFMRQLNRAYYHTHPERYKRWVEANRDNIRTRQAIRRARKRAAPGSYTLQDIQWKLTKQRFKCYYCHHRFRKAQGRYVYHIEHTIPLSRTEEGPRNDIDYIVLACPHCNKSKGSKMPHEWPQGGRLF